MKNLITKYMRVVLSLIFCLAVSSMNQVASQERLGTRLKDFGVSTKIGSLMIYGVKNGSNGAIIDNSKNKIHSKIADEEFNLWQLGYFPKSHIWKGKDGTETTDYTKLNELINLAKAKGKTTQIHVLAGSNGYIPQWWVEKEQTPEEMEETMRELVREVFETNDNKNKIDVWNLMNEMFAYDSSGEYHPETVNREDFSNEEDFLEAGFKLRGMGMEPDESGLPEDEIINAEHPVFIGKMLQYAHELAPNAILEIRDFGIEHNVTSDARRNKFLGFRQLVVHCLKKGYPLHAVGIQGHYEFDLTKESTNPADDRAAFGLETTVRMYKDMGLKVYITEFDMAREKILNFWDDDVEKAQGDGFYKMTKAALKGGADMISIWGYRDGNSKFWLEGQKALVFHEDYRTKDAYYGIQKAFEEYKETGFVTTSIKNGVTIQPIAYPNPTNGVYQVQLNNWANQKNVNVSIKNQLGQLVQEVTNVNTNTITLSLSNQSNGIYFVQISNGKQSQVLKLNKI